MSNPNPLITDTDSPHYTEISKVRVGERWTTLGIIAKSGYSLNAGSDTLLAGRHVDDENIVLGDHVGLGNLRGVVTKIYKGAEDLADKVIALEVTSDARFLPKEFHDNPTAYGYKNKTEIVHTVRLVKDESAVASPTNLVLDGGTAVSAVYHGSVVVFNKQTDDPTTWPREAQYIHKMHNP